MPVQVSRSCGRMRGDSSGLQGVGVGQPCARSTRDLLQLLGSVFGSVFLCKYHPSTRLRGASVQNKLGSNYRRISYPMKS